MFRNNHSRGCERDRWTPLPGRGTLGRPCGSSPAAKVKAQADFQDREVTSVHPGPLVSSVGKQHGPQSSAAGSS